MSKEEREFITKEKALEMIGAKDSIHVLLNPSPSMLVGADWSRQEIENLLDTAESIEIGGAESRRMKHPIVALKGDRFHFIEADI